MYSPEIHLILVRVVKRCGDIRYACKLAGISKSCFYKWRRRAEKGEEPYASLMRDVDEARTEVMVERIEKIAAAGEHDWKALRWLQSKQDPERYGDKLELSNASEDDPHAAYEDLGEEELLEEVASDPRVVEAVRRKIEGAK